MYSRRAAALVCTALLGSCEPFLIAPAAKRQSPQSRNMSTCTSSTAYLYASLVQLTWRKQTGACNAGKEGADGSDGGGDDIDYSADPLTGFIGKFLPSGDKKKPTPQAKDLVRVLCTAVRSR